MEYDAALSAGAHLSGASARLVAEFFLPLASTLGWSWHVFSRAPVDRQPAGRRSGRLDFRFQWAVAEFADVAEPYRDLQLGALGDSGGRARLARRRAKTHGCSDLWRAADAGRRPGDDLAHVALPNNDLDHAVGRAQSSSSARF